MLTALCIGLCAGFGSGAATAADYPMEIIPLRARLPDDLIPILVPLAGPDGSIVGANNTLFVRASPARLADIRRALITLDQPPRSLLIQVRQTTDTQAGGAAVGAQIDTRTGDGRGGGRIDARAGSRARAQDLTQEVRTLDGHAAFIAVGQDQPMGYRELTAGPGGTLVREGRTYQRRESGFDVVPRVQGDQVTLELATRADRPGPRGTRETRQVQARVQGRLGDWIPVALDSDRESVRDADTLYYAEGQRHAQGRVELRVLPLD